MSFDLLKQLDSSWPADYQLQPLNDKEREEIIEVQELKKAAAKEIRILQEAEKALMAISESGTDSFECRTAKNYIDLIKAVRSGGVNGI